LSTRLKAGDQAPNFRFDTPWMSSQDFYETMQHRRAVLVFLRYQGCPVCQMEMANLKRDIELFNQKEARVFVFLQSPASTLMPLTNKDDWPLDIVCDPQGDIFQLYGVSPGGLLKYLHPAGLLSAIGAMGRGFIHGKFEGKETQLPAVFILKPDKTIQYVYYGRNIGDVPKPFNLARHLD